MTLFEELTSFLSSCFFFLAGNFATPFINKAVG